MPYSAVMTFDAPYTALDGLHFCACGEPCTVRVRGKRWSWYLDRFIVCHRWLCDQCKQNLEDDGAELRVVQRQRMTQEQEDAWTRWFDEYGHTL